MPDDDEYNVGYTHEAMHITYVLAQTFDDHVLETRCAERYPDVQAAADKISNALGSLYQLIAGKMAAELGAAEEEQRPDTPAPPENAA